MATTPRYSRYEFLEQVTDNGFTQAWKARDRRSGEFRFIKRPSETSELPVEFILETLQTSAMLQLRLPVSAVNRAISTQKRGEDLLIVYPWLGVVSALLMVMFRSPHR